MTPQPNGQRLDWAAELASSSPGAGRTSCVLEIALLRDLHRHHPAADEIG